MLHMHLQSLRKVDPSSNGVAKVAEMLLKRFPIFSSYWWESILKMLYGYKYHGYRGTSLVQCWL